MGGRRRGHAAGFTLVEVLVAVAIFALIGVMAAQILTRILDAQARTTERGARLVALQRAVQRLERDLLQVSDRGIRDGFGDAQPALRLQLPGVLSFTRDGWRNPLGLPRSELQRVEWRLGEDGTLERAFWTVLDRAEDSEAIVQRILADTEAFAVTVIDAEGAEWEAWPPGEADSGYVPLPGEDPAELPGAVALRIDLDAAPFGRIERLMPLPQRVDVRGDKLEEGNDPGVDGAPDPGAAEEADGAPADAQEGAPVAP
jgi:general secretion pathway protein J